MKKISIGLQDQKMDLAFMNNPKFYKISFINLIILLILLACLNLEKENSQLIPTSCPIKSLMLDKSSFPDGWSQDGPPTLRGAPVRWGTDRLGVSFGTQENGVANQFVHIGENINHAEKGYFKLTATWFDRTEDATDWYVPYEFNYKSKVANQFRFGCRTYEPGGVESCQFVSQYEIYIIRFYTFMSPLMTYDDLKHILQTIDNKTARCLGK